MTSILIIGGMMPETEGLMTLSSAFTGETWGGSPFGMITHDNSLAMITHDNT